MLATRIAASDARASAGESRLDGGSSVCGIQMKGDNRYILSPFIFIDSVAAL